MIQIKETQDKLQIFLPSFNNNFVGIIRQIEGRTYNPANKTWEVPNTQKDHLINQLNEKKLTFNIVQDFNHKEISILILKYNDCIHLRFNSPQPGIKEMLLKTEGAQYLPYYKLWRINLNDLEPLVNKLRQDNITFAIKQRNLNVLSLFAELRYLLDSF